MKFGKKGWEEKCSYHFIASFFLFKAKAKPNEILDTTSKLAVNSGYKSLKSFVTKAEAMRKAGAISLKLFYL